MPIESRALRDWLEVLYADPQSRQDTAYVVELDSHIEEIHNNFRDAFAEHVKKHHTPRLSAKDEETAASYTAGIAHKSVVLVLLQHVLETALAQFGKSRCDHITRLLDDTREFQTTISISARLPGFRRQAVEAWRSGTYSPEFTEALLSGKDGKETLAKWSIVRRMLTRYNWLSTRVGDDAVPIDGVVQGMITIAKEGAKPHVIGLDSLVPLRQRRFEEILGKRWENQYYAENPHPDQIEIFVELDEFRRELKIRGAGLSGIVEHAKLDTAASG